MIEQFVREIGAREVHRVWRDTMLAQAREVSNERMKWELLSDLDHELDAEIARAIVHAYLVWRRNNASTA